MRMINSDIITSGSFFFFASRTRLYAFLIAFRLSRSMSFLRSLASIRSSARFSESMSSAKASLKRFALTDSVVGALSL